MKRRDNWLRNGQPAHQLVHALHHLGSRLVGERHGQDGFRHDSEVLDQMSDAVGDDASLPAPGASQDEHRPVGGFDSLTLLRIELVEERQKVVDSGIVI
jgi:hypothetical protein